MQNKSIFFWNKIRFIVEKLTFQRLREREKIYLFMFRVI